MKKRIFALAMAVIMVIAVMPTLSLAAESTDLPVGTDLMAMNTFDLDGNPVTGDLFTNGSRYTIMSVWATWSDPSKESLVHLETVYEDTIGLNIVGVLFEDASSNADNAKRLSEEMGLTFPTLYMDSVLDELFASTYAPDAMSVPSVHYLVDWEGTVIDAKIGSFKDEFEVLDWLIYHCNQTPYIENNDLSEVVYGTDLSGMNTTDLCGDPVTGDVFRENGFTVLNVWATWCSPSLLDMAALENLNNSDLGVKVMGVLYEDDMSDVKSANRIIENKGLTYQTLRLDSVLSDLLEMSLKATNAIPITYLVDGEGSVIAARLGAFDNAEAMEAWVRSYMDEATTDTHKDVGTMEPTSILGDLNGNKKIEAADATLALRFVAGTLTLSDTEALIGDLNGNRRLDSADATLILRLIIG